MEKIDISNIKYDSNGLVPVIVQEELSKQILMFAYANKDSIKTTTNTKKIHFYSRSRSELWKKGSTSGNDFNLVKILIDCDMDCIIYVVEDSSKVACHTENKTCFYRELNE